MPQKVDYAALAAQARGASSTGSGGGVDYGALASQARTLYSPDRKPASTEDFYQAPKGPEGSSAGRYLSSLGHALDPRPLIKGVVEAVRNPQPSRPEDLALGPGAVLAPLIRGVVGGQVEQGRKAIAGFKSAKSAEDIYEAVGHTGAALLPVLGPAAAAVGEQAATGDFAGAAGAATGLIAPIVAGAVLPKSIGVRGTGVADADAAALAERAGVPLDAATATGNKFVKAVQHVSDRTLAGGVVAERAQKAQQAGLATLGEQLAAKARPQAVSAAEAGKAAQGAVGDVVSTQRAAANDAYGRLRAIEDQAMAAPVPAGQPLTPSPMVVDLAPVKAAMRPIAERLASKKAVTGALMGKEAQAADRIAALLETTDAVPLSVADAALSDLKALARTNNPNLRTAGQGLAARAVSELHEAVSAAAKSSGPEAVAALNDGRLATKAKYAAADVLRPLEGANRQKSSATAFRGMTQAGDTSVGHLKNVIDQAPQTKPMIARAVLDGLIDSPTAGAAKTWSDWQKIGPETKALLYAPEHVKELDSFFKLRKMMADNPNPSGTAHTLLTVAQGGTLWANPVAGVGAQIGAAALSSLLHSRAGVKLLTRGMRIPVRNQAAATVWGADLSAALGKATTPSGGPMHPAGAPAR